MPKLKAELHHVTTVQEALHAAGATHLRARKHGAAVIVESGPEDDPVKHFRVRRDTVHLWCLDMANHRGQWERTPFRQGIGDLVLMVLDRFPWTLTPIAENPARTSDREY
jgi:hypothetical protein